MSKQVAQMVAEIAALDSAKADTIGGIRDCIQESVDQYVNRIEWQPIRTAPKNPSGESYGPWILVFHDHDHEIYQARWECHGNARGWVAKNSPTSFFAHRATHWMMMPEAPESKRPS